MEKYNLKKVLLFILDGLILSLPVFIISRLGFYYNNKYNPNLLTFLIVIVAIASVFLISKIIKNSHAQGSWNFAYAIVWTPFLFILQKIWDLLTNISLMSLTYNFNFMITVVFIFAYSIIILFFVIKEN